MVGYNKGQKQGISMGKKNNQHIVSIPYSRFRHQLGFLCAKNGITFIEGEEQGKTVLCREDYLCAA